MVQCSSDESCGGELVQELLITKVQCRGKNQALQATILSKDTEVEDLQRGLSALRVEHEEEIRLNLDLAREDYRSSLFEIQKQHDATIRRLEEDAKRNYERGLYVGEEEAAKRLQTEPKKLITVDWDQVIQSFPQSLTVFSITVIIFLLTCCVWRRVKW